MDPEQVGEVYAGMFAARHDAYTRWLTDMSHWSAVPEALTGSVVVRAIQSAVPVSGYMIAPGSVTHVWAYDFDREDGLELAMQIGKTAWDVGMPAYAEQSRRGAHLWGCLAEQQSARLVRRALQYLMQLTAIEPDKKLELRPAQDTIPDDGFGNALRLPTMPHPVTKRRYPLLDPRDGEPIGKSLHEMLAAIEYAEPMVTVNLAAAYRPPLDPRYVDDEDRAPRIRYEHGDDDSVCEILRTLWGVQFARPGIAVKCPAHEDQHPSLSILPDDRRVICHSLACDFNNDGHGLGTYQLRKLAYRRTKEDA